MLGDFNLEEILQLFALKSMDILCNCDSALDKVNDFHVRLIVHFEY